jgi:small-conductance mechanosensitive channel
MLDNWRQLLDSLSTLPILKLGGHQLTLGTLIFLLVLFVLLIFLTGRFRRLLVRRLLSRSRLDASAREAVGSLFYYGVIAIGALMILQTAGIDVTTLNVVAGAFGIGVGFGLQNIASNLVSGLIILIERPVKIGDRIEVGAVEGDVVEIRARSTTVVTNDNIAIIIPNSKLISENVVNWSYNDAKVRFNIPVTVAYDSDVRLVEQTLLEVAAENPDVLKDPAPGVRFMAFGDNGLKFELRAWSTTLMHRRGKLVSSINFAIYNRFRQRGIEMPFPQRDIHIRSGALRIQKGEPELP